MDEKKTAYMIKKQISLQKIGMSLEKKINSLRMGTAFGSKGKNYRSEVTDYRTE